MTTLTSLNWKEIIQFMSLESVEPLNHDIDEFQNRMGEAMLVIKYACQNP